jgi:hypothetical protein
MDQKHETKRHYEKYQTAWHSCMCCNPTNGRVDFKDGLLVKFSFITWDKTEACELSTTKARKTMKGILKIDLHPI